eukprot:CAMPEP_0113591012 /NCGR_PEP_ID=MMETSP0015_2-20120614/37011_1 /TAXON_ID=2838 /ORGANISM="Odontella" /LENGTH=426 /DNA_ID=CAMNT_0000497303 /DNA_START=368 /DNA_END=1648 /DNA_ORIENTATION=- /assembly_acc=CAM_ASM_000160
MYAKFALALLLATSAAANPFEPAKTAKKNAAKAKYVNKLVRGAKPTARSQLGRKLDEEEYIPDITGYSVKFEQCQFVGAFDDELADDEEIGTVVGIQRFVVFRLCPTGGDSCNENFGEYIVSMEEYLEAYVGYAQEQQEEWCNGCDEACEADENENQDEDEDDGGRKLDDAQANANYANYDCDTCVDTCYKIENMEDAGYVDATEYLECAEVGEAGDDGVAFFAGPYCSGGEKIKIGVFSDENCMFLDSEKDVEDYLVDGDGVTMKLSHALLKKTYDSSSPVSCLVVDEDADNDNDNGDGDEEEPEVTEMCEQLYEASAKCEKTNGFDDGYANYDGYENQLVQENVVCNFISALKSGTYDEDGSIHLSGSSAVRSSGESGTTGGQKFALTFLIIGTVGLAVYAAMLYTQLTKGAKADLSDQGGAMA